ncbi:MAG: oligosaccharide flippase family protein [Planctomycetota bacterium]|nr:oligosaccharide flippase family protein [Planctomycetota bacterium]MDA1212105.1 oligosaccharide flippase family protein [Planctomycetota bacterium]
MSLTRSLRLNLFSSWLNHAVGLAIGVVLMPYVLHTLGNEQYGTWIFISSVAGYSGLMYLGFGETISRFVATSYAVRDWGRVNQVVSAIWVIYLLMGAVAIGVSAILAWFAPQLYDWGTVPPLEIQAVILVLGLNVAFALVGSVYGGVLMGIQRFDVERSIVMIAGIIRLIATYALLQSSWGLLTMALIHLGITFCENVASYFAAYKLVPTLRVRLSVARWHILKECSSFSLYAFIDSISAQVIDATDSVVIGLFLGAEAIVPYYIALRICHFISRPIQYIGLVSIPRAGELHVGSEARHLHRLVFKGAGLAFLLTSSCLLGSAYFGSALISTWVGSGYEQSYLILMILLSSRVIALTVGVLRSVLFGIGQMKVASLIYLAEGVANITCSLILIQFWGILGVAIGTAVPVLVIELGILLPFALKKIGISRGQFLTEGLAPQLIPVLVLWAYCIAFTSFFPFAQGWFALVVVALGAGLTLAGTLFGRHVLSRRNLTYSPTGT